jgi:phosphate butyryltransferase
VTEPICTFDDLLGTVKKVVQAIERPRVAVVGAADVRTLTAVRTAMAHGWVHPLLIGRKADIVAVADRIRLDLTAIEIMDCPDPEQMVKTAAQLVGDASVDGLFQGDIEISALVDVLQSQANNFGGGRALLSHVAVFEHDRYPRLLLLSDAVVHTAPDLTAKQRIIENAVRIAHALGVACPKVAVLAAVETVYPGMPATLDGAALSKMNQQGEIKDCLVNGPLSMDVAVVREVAEQKGVFSEVAGYADILIAPNIETADGTYRAMSLVARSKTAGVIVGGAVPVGAVFRCDSAENAFRTLMVSAFLALFGKSL